jgi:3-phosphoinositide dependent protein kinase-1
MIEIGLTSPSPESSSSPNLAALSRNASVISTSSSDSSPSLHLKTPPRPRPIRTFTSPRNSSPGPQTPKPPSYLNAELGIPGAQTQSSNTRARSRLRSESPSVHDFTFGPTLGEGSYSTVKQVTHIATGKQFAIKILEKSHLVRHNKVQTATSEKNALVRLGTGHPGIVRLHWAFQDEARLYFVIDLATNGEMQSRIVRMGSLSLECSRYYTAQIVDAIEYMHSKDVIHRDLKPENVLLDSEFRIKLTDFGTGKIVEPGSIEKPKTFVGTAQYVSPELLEANETSKSSDLWALGCIVYQMIAGRFAFQGLSEYLTWQKIKQLDYTFPDGFDPDAKDFVQKLLVKDPTERLGAGEIGSQHDMQALRSHPFLSSIKWDTLWTDSSPALLPGLVVREHSLSSSNDHNWDDVGAAWDDLVDSDGDSDGLDWVSEQEAALLQGLHNDSPLREDGPAGDLLSQYSHNGDSRKVCFDEASHSIIPPIPPQTDDAPPTVIQGGQSYLNDSSPTDSIVSPVPLSKAAGILNNRDGAAGSSTASSSEGSPVERLGAVLDSMKLPFRAAGSRRSSPDKDTFKLSQPAQSGPIEDEAAARGRARDPPQSLVSITITGMLAPGESILHSGEVDAKAIRRRASRLIPLAVSPVKPKSRHLVLTNQRLICFKPRSRIKGQPSLKLELPLKAPASDKDVKDKDLKPYVSQVEAKGEREFVILTTTKSFTFGLFDTEAAASWVKRINAALEIANEISRT